MSAEATVQKEITVPIAPVPTQLRDIGSSTTNDQLTKNNIGELSGARLKFDPDKTDEGIFFVPAGAGSVVKVTTVQQNKPAKLVFLIPDSLAAGQYLLQVRARAKGSTKLRSGELSALLTVT